MFSWSSSSVLYKTIGILDDEELLTVYQRPETRELFDDRIHNKKKHWNAIYRSTSCNLDICDFFGMFIHTPKYSNFENRKKPNVENGHPV